MAFYPAARRRDKTGTAFGFPAGTRGGNVPAAVVNHRTASPSPTSDDENFLATNTSNSVHFLVKRTGEVVQFLDTLDCAWANGVVNKGPYTPAWLAARIDAGQNPNKFTISIEHQAYGTSEGFTEAQIAASCKLNAWLCSYHIRTIQPSRDHVIGHHQIDWANKQFCPGTMFPFERVVYAVKDRQIELYKQKYDAAIVELGNCNRTLKQARADLVTCQDTGTRYRLERDHAQSALTDCEGKLQACDVERAQAISNVERLKARIDRIAAITQEAL